MENVVHFQPPIIHCAPQSLRPVKLKIAHSETFRGHSCCNSSVNSPKLLTGQLHFSSTLQGTQPCVTARMLLQWGWTSLPAASHSGAGIEAAIDRHPCQLLPEHWLLCPQHISPAGKARKASASNRQDR